MAYLFGKMDIGNGLPDKFLIAFPQCYRPLPQQQIEAMEKIQSYNFEISTIYDKIKTNMSVEYPVIFYFDDYAQK